MAVSPACSVVCMASVVVYMLFLGCGGGMCSFVSNYIKFRQKAGCNVNLCFPDAAKINKPDDNVTEFKWTHPRPKCCSNCSCDTDCHRRGDCCPDVRHTRGSYPPGGIFQCISDHLKPDGMLFENNPQDYWLVSKCHVQYRQKDVRERCETPNRSNFREHVPVLYKHTSESYRNVFCAICNLVNISAIVPWNARVKCDFSTLSNVTIANVVDKTRAVDDCNMIFSLPVENNISNTCFGYKTKTCNETGDWQLYDRTIEDACESYISPYKGDYQNIFCYVCNKKDEDELDTVVCLEKNGWTSKSQIPAFSMLFDFSTTDEMNAMDYIPKCSRGYVYDSYKRTCKRVFCSDGFVYDGFSCKPGSSPHELCYSAYFQFTPVDGHITSSKSPETGQVPVDTVVEALRQHFVTSFTDHYIEGWDFHLMMNVTEGAPIFDTNHVMYIILHMIVSYNKHLANSLLDIDGSDISVVLDKNKNAHSVQNGTLPSDGLVTLSTLKVTLLNTLVRTGFILGTNAHLLYVLDNNTYRESSISVFSSQQRLCKDNPTRQFTPTTHCPLVELDTSQFNVITTSKAMYFINLNMQIHLHHIDEQETEAGTVIKVCISNYLPLSPNWTHSVGRRHPNSMSMKTTTTSIISSYLTLICTVLSISSLVFTLLTYSIFPALRSQPGINNMCLAVSLLAAQCIFVFGIRQTQHHTLCSFLAGMLHLSWLLVLCWTGVCSFHMFRVFREIRIHNHIQGNYKTSCCYLAFCFITSLLIVAATSMESFIKSEGGDFGYGPTHGMCWLSNHQMVLVTLSVPATMISINNFCMFVVVIFQIKDSSRVTSASRRNRSNFTVYVKLSTVTGLTWFSSIPFYVTNIEIFEYIFILLYANQGLFLMLAFVCNRRVLSMYRALWCSTNKTRSQNTDFETARCKSEGASKTSVSVINTEMANS